MNNKLLEKKQIKEKFSQTQQKGPINSLIDEILSYFPFYFRMPIKFFRSLLEKSFDDPMYLVYTYGIFCIMKVYIRGRVMPASEVYADSRL